MQRHVNAELEFDEKFIKRGVDQGIRHRVDEPDSASVLFVERYLRQWRRKAMILDGKLDCFAIIGAAEERKAIHALRRNVKSQARAVSKKGIAGKRDRIAAALDDLVQRNARSRKGKCARGKPAVLECGRGCNPLRREDLHDRRNFGDWIDYFVRAYLDHAVTPAWLERLLIGRQLNPSSIDRLDNLRAQIEADLDDLSGLIPGRFYDTRSPSPTHRHTTPP